jgi:DNA-binding transcriptional MerR regulator
MTCEPAGNGGTGEGARGGAAWKVGELARATGLTVRTLHHYDAIGVLSPSHRTAAGHRIYTDADVGRLYRISLLRRLGLPLGQIARSLEDPAWTLAAAVRRHVRELDRRVAVSQRLRHRLSAIELAAGQAEHTGPPDPANPPDARAVLRVLEDMIMLDTAVQRRISILVYEDIEAAHDHLVRVFGLEPGSLERDGDGTVVHGEVQAGDGVIWLHRVSPDYGLASPRALGATTGMLAIMVEDVDEHYQRAVAAGADIVYAPTDQAYGLREYCARGSEGELWAFMTPLD